MNKTIYVRDEDGWVWDKARELAGDKLSPVIVEALKSYIHEKETEAAKAKGFERIVLKYEDSEANYIPRAKAFHGRWIIPIEYPLKEAGIRERGRRFAVAITPKNSVVIYSWHCYGDQYEKNEYWLRVYTSFEEAAKDNEANYAARTALERIGVPVEELDI